MRLKLDSSYHTSTIHKTPWGLGGGGSSCTTWFSGSEPWKLIAAVESYHLRPLLHLQEAGNALLGDFWRIII